jgi:hypothetical protein
MYIARKPQQVGVILYDNALISTLEQMTTSIMSPVEALGVSGAKPVHGPFQISPAGSDQKVIMIAHQDIGKNVYLKTL